MIQKIMKLVTLTACVLLVKGCSTAEHVEAVAPEPAYVCAYAVDGIEIDGKLDERAWQTAEVVSRFYPFTSATDPDLSPTEVRMLWDETNLYVSFQCEDDDIWSYSNQNDDTLWHGDVVELFIQTDVAGLGYIELVAAPNGALFDAKHESRGGGGYRRFKGWSCGAVVASKIDGTDGDWADTDNGYTLELAIPLASLGLMKDNAWTFGVFRYNYSKSFEEPQLLMSIPEAPKWGFHYYPGYRLIEFHRAR